MIPPLEDADIFSQLEMFSFRQSPVQETFSYIINSLLRRMAHILRIETVIAEFIHHDLIGREIVCSIIQGSIDPKKKSRLT